MLPKIPGQGVLGGLWRIRGLSFGSSRETLRSSSPFIPGLAGQRSRCPVESMPSLAPETRPPLLRSMCQRFCLGFCMVFLRIFPVNQSVCPCATMAIHRFAGARQKRSNELFSQGSIDMRILLLSRGEDSAEPCGRNRIPVGPVDVSGASAVRPSFDRCDALICRSVVCTWASMRLPSCLRSLHEFLRTAGEVSVCCRMKQAMSFRLLMPGKKLPWWQILIETFLHGNPSTNCVNSLTCCEQ